MNKVKIDILKKILRTQEKIIENNRRIQENTQKIKELLKNINIEGINEENTEKQNQKI